jgi:hypothetical protein
MTAPESPKPHNPYVGPRAFKYGEKLYGRDREVLELLDLLIAERIVLLYSPSGAGKSSLVQAGLIPELEQEGFTVLPVIRVNQDLPASTDGDRYLYSTLLSLEEGQAEADQLDEAVLVDMSLNDYLTRREAELAASEPGLEGLVLIFDQFEEILTLDPTNQAARQNFFKSVGEALRQPHRWVLFSMREDYLAGLDPYLRLIPTRLNTTFRLDLLNEAVAREAIQKPAETGGVTFAGEAAAKLMDDLRWVKVQQPDWQY